MVCTGCRDGNSFDFDFSMAFQPIVDLATGEPYAYEALIRGPEGESAPSILSRVTETNRYAFDQRCRVKAIETAARAGILGTPAKLSINFLPNAVYSPVACIQLTLKTSRALDFPIDRLISSSPRMSRWPIRATLPASSRRTSRWASAPHSTISGQAMPAWACSPASSPIRSSSTWSWSAASTRACRGG
jgi:hypothetical protein